MPIPVGSYQKLPDSCMFIPALNGSLNDTHLDVLQPESDEDTCTGSSGDDEISLSPLRSGWQPPPEQCMVSCILLVFSLSLNHLTCFLTKSTFAASAQLPICLRTYKKAY